MTETGHVTETVAGHVTETVAGHVTETDHVTETGHVTETVAGHVTDSSRFLPCPWCQWPLLAHRGTALHPGGHAVLPSTGACHLAGSVAGAMISRGGGGGGGGVEG